jgi:hypothetical protein
MGNENNWDHHPGVSPENLYEQVRGLEDAADATRAKIEEYKAKGWNPEVYIEHLASLEDRIKKAKDEIDGLLKQAA